MLQILNLTYRIGGHTVLDRATASVSMNARVALVGRNGAGKSTLLGLIAGLIDADGGTIELPRRSRTAMVAQHAPDGPESLVETVLAADRGRVAALAALEQAERRNDAEEIGLAHARLHDLEAHSAPARAAEVLAGLGFAHDEMSRPCASFSGGWRMRVALAAALFQRADVLLLDEPSNHLDFEAAAWLEAHLLRFSGMLILVSHDREMLDRIAQRVLHLEEGRLTDYRGNYSAFERARSERRLAQARESQVMDAQRKRLETFVARFRAKATKARQAQSRLKALEKMTSAEPITADRQVKLNFPDAEPLAPPLITIDRGVVGYDGTMVLQRLDLRIDMDNRIALLGPNGNGKSTLIKLLAGRLLPMTGTIRHSPKLRVGYFAQHQADELDPAASAYMHLLRAEPETPEPRLRAHLGRFGLEQQKADVAVRTLSGGEKARLLLALMSRDAPHLLLLDEPTNHLDIEARSALVDALNGFSGAVVLVSHDPFLINHVADRLWRLADGTCTPFNGDLDDYRNLVLDEARAFKRVAAAAQGPDGGRRAVRREAAAAREAQAPLRRAVRVVETALDRLVEELAAIEVELARPETYEGPAEAVSDLLRRQRSLQKEFEAAETRWVEAVELLEAAQAHGQ